MHTKHKLSNRVEIVLFTLLVVAVVAVFFSVNIQQVDNTILSNVVAIRTTSGTMFMLLMTQFGTAEAIIAGFFILCFIFIPLYKWHELLFFVASLGGSAIVVEVIKHAVARPRPPLSTAIYAAPGFSFPSGHTFLATVFYGAVLYMLFRVLKNREARKIAYFAAMFIIAAVGFSRIYLGVHWTSDVVTSYILGFIWLGICIRLFEKSEAHTGWIQRWKDIRRLHMWRKTLVPAVFSLVVLWIAFIWYLYAAQVAQWLH